MTKLNEDGLRVLVQPIVKRVDGFKAGRNKLYQALRAIALVAKGDSHLDNGATILSNGHLKACVHEETGHSAVRLLNLVIGNMIALDSGGEILVENKFMEVV